ncbi:Micrococcal nuclease (thermonuclease)-like protein [Hoeflea phototrophica DFL-43]|uniref:Micrococcal nuclease (Thermonuclease)-like protein n=1 Tax=Hoeflea phototrophica (strain DSM 17068 / NCIMB 14078 / DFL-43) TaxID=411684 RepID=A9D316_HOEPD|nr:Micrococcal nuclease (thermonuclease)-like protein [Hoeflea phototrophica DFL-43]
MLNLRLSVSFILTCFLMETGPAAAMELCSGPNRVTCVVDGDTVWIEGEKIRLEGIDAPEPRGRCYEELIAAAKATERLRILLTENQFTIKRSGQDRYGRTLAKIMIGDRSAGEIMMSEGLVRKWRGKRESWCK